MRYLTFNEVLAIVSAKTEMVKLIYDLVHRGETAGGYDPVCILNGLDETINTLRTVRQALAHATTPPQVAWCRSSALCSWAGTTHAAAWNADDGEYRCPECGSADNLVIMDPTEATEVLAECQGSASPAAQTIYRGITATLEQIAAWRFGQPEVRHD